MCQRVSLLGCDVSTGAGMCCSELPVRGGLVSDVSTRAAAPVTEVGLWGLGPSWAPAAGTESRGRAGKAATKPKTSLRRRRRRDGDTGRPRLQYVITTCILTLFPDASLFYAIAKTVLCHCECGRLWWRSHTAHRLLLRLQSYGATAPPTHTWKTTIALSYSPSSQLVGVLTNTGSNKGWVRTQSSLCVCICVCLATADRWWQSKAVYTHSCDSVLTRVRINIDWLDWR